MASWSERLVTIPPGRHTLPRAFVSAHQRQRILAATAELVAKRGYHGTSIDLITQTARVALSTFYEIFESKEHCFIAAFDDAVAEAQNYLATAIDSQQPWSEQISAGLEVLLELVVANPAKARMCLVEAPGGGAALLDRYESALDGFIPILRKGRQFARGKKLPDRTEEAIVGGLVWVLYQHIVIGDFDGIRAVRRQSLVVALGPYLGQGEAKRFTEIANSDP